MKKLKFIIFIIFFIITTGCKVKKTVQIDHTIKPQLSNIIEIKIIKNCVYFKTKSKTYQLFKLKDNKFRFIYESLKDFPFDIIQNQEIIIYSSPDLIKMDLDTKFAYKFKINEDDIIKLKYLNENLIFYSTPQKLGIFSLKNEENKTLLYIKDLFIHILDFYTQAPFQDLYISLENTTTEKTIVKKLKLNNPPSSKNFANLNLLNQEKLLYSFSEKIFIGDKNIFYNDTRVYLNEKIINALLTHIVIGNKKIGCIIKINKAHYSAVYDIMENKIYYISEPANFCVPLNDKVIIFAEKTKTIPYSLFKKEASIYKVNMVTKLSFKEKLKLKNFKFSIYWGHTQISNGWHKLKIYNNTAVYTEGAGVSQDNGPVEQKRVKFHISSVDLHKIYKIVSSKAFSNLEELYQKEGVFEGNFIQINIVISKRKKEVYVLSPVKVKEVEMLYQLILNILKTNNIIPKDK